MESQRLAEEGEVGERHVAGTCRVSLACSASSDYNGEPWEAVTKLARLPVPDVNVSGGGTGSVVRVDE